MTDEVFTGPFAREEEPMTDETTKRWHENESGERARQLITAALGLGDGSTAQATDTLCDTITALRTRLAKAEARSCACCAGITLSAGCAAPLASAMLAAERFRETLLTLFAPEHTPEMRADGAHHPETHALRRRVLDRVGFCWLSPGEMAPACLCGFSEPWSPERSSVSSDHLAWRLRGADREETAFADLAAKLTKAEEEIAGLRAALVDDARLAHETLVGVIRERTKAEEERDALVEALEEAREGAWAAFPQGPLPVPGDPAASLFAALAAPPSTLLTDRDARVRREAWTVAATLLAATFPAQAVTQADWMGGRHDQHAADVAWLRSLAASDGK